MSLNGYQAVANVTVEGRALQARALMNCARALNDAMRSQNHDELMVAATNNSKLWLFFYSEIEAGNVSLPPEVATNIMSLAAYVAKVTPRAMGGERTVLETLISINQNIAAGLSTEQAETPKEVPAMAAAVNAGFSTSA